MKKRNAAFGSQIPSIFCAVVYRGVIVFAVIVHTCPFPKLSYRRGGIRPSGSGIQPACCVFSRRTFVIASYSLRVQSATTRTESP